MNTKLIRTLIAAFALGHADLAKSQESTQFQTLSAQMQSVISAMQNGSWCATIHDTAQSTFQNTLNQTYNLAVVFVDFNDGRLPAPHPNAGKPPQDSLELQYFEDNGGNLDALGGFGYRDRGSGNMPRWNKQVNKYKWRDYWQMHFSRGGVFKDNDATGYHPHPDYKDHKTRAFGSLVEFWDEASYGNAKFVPYAFRTGADTLQGIVNNWETDAQGNRIVKWISMGITKSAATSSAGRVDSYVLDNIRTVLQNEFNAGRIAFNVSAYLNASPNNKLLAILAGNAPGGAANGVFGNVGVAREKLGSNSWFAACAMLDNLGVAAHELGHLIGFRDAYGQFVGGTSPALGYSLYGNGSLPFNGGIAHPDSYQRLRLGWVKPIFIRRDTTEVELFPVEKPLPLNHRPHPNDSLPRVGVVALCGVPGAKNGGGFNWQHSEYYILENRQRLGTEVFVGGKNEFLGNPDGSSFFGSGGTFHFTGAPPASNRLLNDTLRTILSVEPSGFQGGLLISHRIMKAKTDTFAHENVIPLEADGMFNFSAKNNTDRRASYTDFYGAFGNHIKTTIDSTTSPNTNTSSHFPSGLKLYHISNPHSDRHIKFSIAYQAGQLPNYDFIVDISSPQIPQLSGNILLLTNDLSKRIASGAIVDIGSNSVSLTQQGLDTAFIHQVTFQGVRCGHHFLTYNSLSIPLSTNIFKITNSTFKDANVGLLVRGSSVRRIIKNCTFRANLVDFQVQGNSSVDITGYDSNIFSKFQLIGSSLDTFFVREDFTLPLSSLFEILRRPSPFPPSIPSIKFSQNKSLILNGTLKINSGVGISTFSNELPNQKWGGIIFNQTSRFSEMRNTKIEHALTGIQFNGIHPENPPQIINTHIFNSQDFGIYIAPAQSGRSSIPTQDILLDSCLIKGNSVGVLISGIDKVQLRKTRITQNPIGVEVIGASPKIVFSKIDSSDIGVKLDNASPLFGRCTITDNETGVSIRNASSPNFATGFGYTDTSGRNAFNTLGNDYFLVAFASTPVLGYHALPYNVWGFNAFYGENHIYAGENSYVLVRNNYFRRPPSFFAEVGSTIDNDYILEEEPDSVGWSIQGNRPLSQTPLLSASVKPRWEIDGEHLGNILDSLEAMIRDAKRLRKWGNVLSRLALFEQSSSSLAPIEILPILRDSEIPAVVRKRAGLWIANRLYASGSFTVAQSFFTTLRRHCPFESQTSDLAVIEALNELYYRWNFERANIIITELSQQMSSMGLSGVGDTDIEKNLRSLRQIVNVSFQMYNRVAHLPIEEQSKFNEHQLAVTQSYQSLAPKRYVLAQNYPNPFNPTTIIRYALPRASFVKIEVFDVLGRRVAVLVNGWQEAVEKVVYFNASHYSSGTYFYRMQAGTFLETKKMLLIK